MKSIDRTLSVLMIATLFFGVFGCMENIALIGRPSIAEGEKDVVGEVERVDLTSRRIYLRADRGGRQVVSFSADAQVLDRGREYPVSRLEPGDVVAMQLRRDSRGESYADLIRVQDNVRQRAPDQKRDTLAESAPRVVALSGRVDRVDPRGNSFELNDQPGKPILVVLSEYVRDSDRERFRTLRAGDHVRIEGQFTGEDRFELLSFLNDEY
ncbi:MAG TPA: hypothetical protein VMR20_08830 [Verrucomicrobiae bacterium]|nr:hypothetical protein [Verrucomicrobiae bacterium]